MPSLSNHDPKAIRNLIVLVSILMPLAAATTATAATITLKNDSGLEIHHVFLSPSSQDAWGPDQLGSYVLEHGDEITIETECGNYDLRLGGPDGEVCELHGAYLCGHEGVSISEQDLLACAQASGGLPAPPSRASGGASVTVSNHSGFDIHELYLSSTSTANWGPDQLGNDILPSGGQLTLFGTPCDRYDVRLVDEDGDVCVLENESLCGNEEAVIGRQELLACQGYD